VLIGVITLGLLGLLGWLAWLLYQRLHPPPPPPASVVFGVALNDFETWYDQNITVQPNATLTFGGAVLTADRLNVQCPGGYSVATLDQLQLAAYRGMQCCAWGICQASTSTQLIGAFPMQAGVKANGTALCGSYDSTADVVPRVVGVTSVPSDSALPTVVWMYGPPLGNSAVFRFQSDDQQRPGRAVLPWFQPLPGQPGSVQWSYDNRAPLPCGDLGHACQYPWATTLDGTSRFLSYTTPPGSSMAYLTLTTAQTSTDCGLNVGGCPPLWQLLSSGFLVTSLNLGTTVAAVSYPTASEGLPLAVLPFASVAAIATQPPQEGKSGVTPTGASSLTQNADGTLTLTAFPTYGLAYGTAIGLSGSYIVLTTNQSQWLKFQPIGWTAALSLLMP